MTHDGHPGDTGRGRTPVVEAARTCVAYDGDCVVDEVDLVVWPGDFVAILGENGSGKSTLVKAMLGLVPLSHGSVRLHGVPVGDFKDWDRIGYVPQKLLSAGSVPVSVREAVSSARWNPRRRLRPDTKADRDAVRSALGSVGLWARRDDRLDTLSGGQQRRVLIARALAIGADTLVLDEPTAGVDAESQVRLAATLAELKAAGRTVLMVTHELAPIAGLPTRALVLGSGEHGSVRYDGPPRPEDLAHHHAWHHTEDMPPEPAAPAALLER